MHGLIFTELNKYVTNTYTKEHWKEILKDAGLENRLYETNRPYPDNELFTIMASMAKMTNVSIETHLFQIGEFIVPSFFKIFSYQIRKEWKTLDLLENVETTMHKAARINYPGATPPVLKIARKGKRSIEILYYSMRNIPMLAKGFLSGIAKFYGEIDKITIDMKESDNPKGWLFTITMK